MESVSTVPTPAVPPPGTKSQGASSEQMGKIHSTPVLISLTYTRCVVNECLNLGSVGGGESGSVAAAATGGGGGEGKEEKEVPVDESLFTEQGDDPDNQEADGGARVELVEDEVPVDESLFDIENLDIDDDDPSLAQTQGGTKD